MSAGLGGLATLMLLLGVRDRFWPDEPEAEPMTGDVNIAVAEFGSIGTDGNITVTRESSDLAASAFETLERELSALETDPAAGLDIIDFEVQPPDVTGPVEGGTRGERAAHAERIGERTAADIVLYAIVEEAASETSLRPEFFLTDRKLELDPEVLVGDYRFGAPLVQQAAISANPTARSQLRAGLIDRTNGLVQLVVGLFFFGAGEYGTANEVFGDIQRAALLPADGGLEIVHLFRGNAAGREGDVELAASEYESALEINPEFARAQIGLAETVFQRSHKRCERDSIDVAGVRQALDMYRGALDAEDRPARSNVDVKVAFGVGRAHLCLSTARVESSWAEARAELDSVVDAYDAGNTAVTELAAEALSSLGLLEIQTDGDGEASLERAVADLNRAIEISADPGRRAAWYGYLGYAHCLLGNAAKALEAYDMGLDSTTDEPTRQTLLDGRERAAAESSGC